MTEEIKTIIVPVPWTMTMNEDGTRTFWYRDVELGLGNFKGFYYVMEDFRENWSRDYEKAFNLDYVISIRPPKGMPIDEKLLILKKFINEPLIKENLQ